MNNSSDNVICMKIRQTERITVEGVSKKERLGCSKERVKEFTFHEFLFSFYEEMLRIKLGFC